jgi:UDP-glucose 4-epimerase
MKTLPEVRGKRFVVTGGAGFIGSHIAEALVKQGKEVVVVDNFRTGKRENLEPWWDPKLCTLHEVEIGNPDAMAHVFDGADTVIHEAASKCTVCQDDPLNDLLVNAWGSFLVFEMAALAGVKTIVYASTGSVYGIGGSKLALFKPESYYGVSKLAAEHYLRILAFKHHFNYAVLRYHHVYGPRQDSSDRGGVVPIFIRRALANKPIRIYGDGGQTRWFCHVEDVVRITLASATRSHLFPRNVRGPEYCTIDDLAQEIRFLTGSGSDIVFAPEREGDIHSFEFSNNIFEEVGKITLNEGLPDTIAWYKERGFDAAA